MPTCSHGTDIQPMDIGILEPCGKAAHLWVPVGYLLALIPTKWSWQTSAGWGQRAKCAGSAVQVDSSDMFEMLALGIEPDAAHAANVGRLSCGAGALTMPRFAPQRVALRVHATSSFADAHTYPRNLKSPYDMVPFEYQVVIENMGSVPVEVLGRFFEIQSASGTTTVGSRDAPAEGVIGCRPVVLPGGAMMYHSFAKLSMQGGSMRGGYLVRPSPGARLDCSCCGVRCVSCRRFCSRAAMMVRAADAVCVHMWDALVTWGVVVTGARHPMGHRASPNQRLPEAADHAVHGGRSAGH